jgi:hypothetical protein
LNLCSLIKKERQKKYPSPSNFYKKNKLSCSYYHYTKIENGTNPDIKLAVEILRALEIPIKKGIYALIRSEMPDKESRALFSDPEKSEFKSYGDKVSFDESIIVNHSQVKLLNSNPFYLEILLFMSCNMKKQFSTEEISDIFKITFNESHHLLKNLVIAGLVCEDNELFSTKNWIYTPDDKDFRDLKDNTIKRALEKHLSQCHNIKWQKTLTINASDEVKKTIEDMLENLSKSIVGLSEDCPESKPMTVGLFSSWRSFGNG